MHRIHQGTVTLEIEDELAPPEQAGHLSPKEVARLVKAPHGIGLACANAADAIERAGGSFVLPASVTPDALRKAGYRAEHIDQALTDLRVVTATLEQAKLLDDAAAYDLLCQLNDQLKVQLKHEPQLAQIFEQVLAFFARGHHKAKTAAE